MNKFLVLSFICLSLTLHAKDFSGKDAMNEINFNDYKDFPEKWGLVTIRFRKDTGEMRITYGNDLAIKTLNAGAINYPDGAVFAKIGFYTSVDSQFISSVVPKGVRRYQLMVKDKKKYASTGGWGYGLFDPRGKTFPEDPKITQDACYACHTIVENRGDVFSAPFSISPAAKYLFSPPHENSQLIKYRWIKSKELPQSIVTLLPKTTTRIRMMEHEKMRKNIFQGTLDEVKPLLEHESRTSDAPALFASEDLKRFVLVIPTRTQECNDMGAFEIISTDLNLKTVTEKYCTHD